MKKALIILLFLMIPGKEYGQLWNVFYEGFQSAKVDSITMLLPGIENQALADAYVELALLHRQHDYDKCIEFAEMALNIKGVSENAASHALLYKGQAEYFKGDFVDAIKSLSLGRELIEKSTDKVLLVELYVCLGLAFHYSQIKPETGQRLFAKTLEISEKEGLKRPAAYSYFLFGRFFLDSLQLDQALINFHKAARIMVDENHGTKIEKALSWILIGHCYKSNNDIRSAMVYYQKAYEWLDTTLIADCSILAQQYAFLGSFYLASNQIDSALNCLTTGLHLANKSDNSFFAAINHKHLASLYQKTNNMPAAFRHYKEALDQAALVVRSGHIYRNPAYRHLPGHGQEVAIHLPITFRVQSQRQLIMAVHHELYQIYLQQHDYKNALLHFQSYTAMNDTIQQVLKRKDMEELGYVFETEHKDQKINFLEQQNQLKESKARLTMIIFFGTSMMLLLAIFALILLMRQGKLRSRQQAVVLKQKLLRSQMNPHFIFNFIASIQNKIISDKPEIASDYLSSFSHLFRNILEGSFMEFIPLDEEIATVNNYLELQQMRYPDTFSYDIMVDEKLDTEEVYIPPMLSQPFIENAIEHGVRHKETAGKISVRYWRQNGFLRVEIEDDGIGRKKARERQMKSGTDHKSHATNITLERIAILNRRKKKKITMEILDVKDDKDAVCGTKVVFNFPA